MSSSYSSPWFLFNSHLQTIYPALARRVPFIPFDRERIDTPDHDFLDLDWYRRKSGHLLIISHGLEGNSTRPYVLGMVQAALGRSMDVLAWNFRGCSGEINRLKRFYHSGDTGDLKHVIDYAARHDYDHIYLLGFSLGGNVTLKYLGEGDLHPKVRRAVGVSVPLDLESSCVKISRPQNWIYANRFLRSLKGKILMKHRNYPELDISLLRGIRTLMQFDDVFTAPLHGFSSAHDYYERSSSLPYLKQIPIPTLVLNAKNDPFLSLHCFLNARILQNELVSMESPDRGGHVGFAQFRKNGLYWSEERALDFLQAAVD